MTFGHQLEGEKGNEKVDFALMHPHSVPDKLRDRLCRKKEGRLPFRRSSIRNSEVKLPAYRGASRLRAETLYPGCAGTHSRDFPASAEYDRFSSNLI
jgi:hypothetical protein